MSKHLEFLAANTASFVTDPEALKELWDETDWPDGHAALVIGEPYDAAGVITGTPQEIGDQLRAYLALLGQWPPKVQLVHSRDPDSECDTTAYVDGKRVKDVEVEDIDPGRGYDAEYIAERRAEAEATFNDPDATEYDLDRAQSILDARYDRFSLGD